MAEHATFIKCCAFKIRLHVDLKFLAQNFIF
jgi:hypothetical protein